MVRDISKITKPPRAISVKFLVLLTFNHSRHRHPHHLLPPLQALGAPLRGLPPLQAALKQCFGAKQLRTGRTKLQMRGRRAQELRELVGAAVLC